MDFYRSHVLVCGGTGCHSSGSATIEDMFNSELKAKGLEKEVKIVNHRKGVGQKFHACCVLVKAPK